MRACVRACVRACMHVGMRVCVCVANAHLDVVYLSKKLLLILLQSVKWGPGGLMPNGEAAHPAVTSWAPGEANVRVLSMSR